MCWFYLKYGRSLSFPIFLSSESKNSHVNLPNFLRTKTELKFLFIYSFFFVCIISAMLKTNEWNHYINSFFVYVCKRRLWSAVLFPLVLLSSSSSLHVQLYTILNHWKNPHLNLIDRLLLQADVIVVMDKCGWTGYSVSVVYTRWDVCPAHQSESHRHELMSLGWVKLIIINRGGK